MIDTEISLWDANRLLAARSTVPDDACNPLETYEE